MYRALLAAAKRRAAAQPKTRLCPPLTAEAAAALYACFLRDTLDIMRAVPGVARGIVYLPETAFDYLRVCAGYGARATARRRPGRATRLSAHCCAGCRCPTGGGD